MLLCLQRGVILFRDGAAAGAVPKTRQRCQDVRVGYFLKGLC